MLTLKQSRRLRNGLLGLLCWGHRPAAVLPDLLDAADQLQERIDAFATPPQFIFQPTLENYLHQQAATTSPMPGTRC